MFREMLVETEGDWFYTDGTIHDEISFIQAMEIAQGWYDRGEEINENVKFSGLVKQFWIQ